ncbi:NAD(P)-dependent alcohol dehydrogenase [Chitinophaga horti]|uniref:NAD(P)-dependent alcohol dehydrogenase n=1 Tax=Chitinophaga horti TaxID=2920382 RepID=A0ABY6JAQ0_9BACT|nr:NAD(P)-dependent alcohol dehydrogenase [Chitinophaga horti]UYQ95384.1 NAD(P)-dependent alcohol dehydrogenase [Chitinophaga horti]
MKAAVLANYGAPENFQVKEVEVPEIKDGQILVHNYASSVNPVDTMVRKGALRLVSGLFGEQIIGSDFAGVVNASKSAHFKPGDEVFGFKNAVAGHAYAEYVVVDEDNAAIKPYNISFAEAASLPLVALTAYQGLTREGKVMPGQQILINGCTGGVGCMAVQIAKKLGAIVTGTCSAHHMIIAGELGCDEVIDYEKSGIPQDGRYDVIFDTAAQLTLSDIEKSLKPEGVLVTTKPPSDDLGEMLSSAVDLFRARMRAFMVEPVAKDLEVIRQLVEAGELRPVVMKTFPLANTGLAHKMLEAESVTGKIVIEI